MEKKILSHIMIIQPQYLSSDLFLSHILTQLKKIEMTCNIKYGFIEYIYRIVNLQDVIILDDGSCKLNVFFEASCFFPQIGKKIKTKVEMIFEHGIFTSLYVLRFLIPISNLKNYNYIPNIGFEENNTKNIIKNNHEIEVEITNCKFENGHFSCIAKIIN